MTGNTQHSAYAAIRKKNPWSPGAFARLPWLGALAVVGTLCGLAASAAILFYSDQKSIAAWRFQPATYLAIASTITNICLSAALKEGVNITWWKRSLQGTVAIPDLHRFWSHGSSFVDAVFAGKHFGLLALACIMATLAQVNSPLLQRASRVVLRTQSMQTSVNLHLESALPYGFSGWTSGRGYAVSLFTTAFSPIVQDWNRNATIHVGDTGCRGICAANVKGVGLSVNCSSYTIPFTLVPDPNVPVGPVTLNGTYVFESHFQWQSLYPGDISFGITFKDLSDCSGVLQVRNCSMRAAAVQYPVVIDGNQSTITLQSSSTIFDDIVDHSLTLDDMRNNQGPTTIGGLQLALNNRFNSWTHLRWVGAVGYELTSAGTTANQYAIVGATSASSTSPATDCTLSFSDPSADFLAAARDLMFRSSIAAVNKSTSTQTVQASETLQHAIYTTNYVYMAIALGITLLALLVVVCTYTGYQRLGRKFSMSPVETAVAFDAPMLRGEDSNAPIQELIDGMEVRDVRYVAVAVVKSSTAREYSEAEEVSRRASQPGKYPHSSNSRLGDEAAVQRMRLQMSYGNYGISPRKGWTFDG